MHGNVRQFCQDWYSNDYNGQQELESPGDLPHSYKYVAMRGGSSNSDSLDCRSASRGGYDPVERGYVVGFRVVMELSLKKL